LTVRRHDWIRASGTDTRADPGLPAVAGIAGGGGSGIGRVANAGPVASRAGLHPRHAVPTATPGAAIGSTSNGFPMGRLGDDTAAGG
jgi:hypothetical protein